MGAFFSNIVFINPWILAGLAALPVLWFLLRITPPAPKLILLPSVRFLQDLIPEDRTPSHTPWWLLLLRIIIAALVITALAHPVFNPAGSLPGSGPVRLVLDNGWAAAQTWTRQMQAAEEALARAGRENREIYILTTAPTPGGDAPVQSGPLAAGEALAVLRGLAPLPWPENYEAAERMIAGNRAKKSLTSLWFAHGLNTGGKPQAMTNFIRTLQAQGGLSYTAPEPGKLPLLLALPEKPGFGLRAAIHAPETVPAGLPVTVQALAEDGRILDLQKVTLDPGALPASVTFDIPETLRNDVALLRLQGREGTGGVFILGERYKRRAVGIVAPPEKTETAPLVEAGYYLKRALEPYTKLYQGSVDEILNQGPSLIILPDIGAMPADTLNKLESWVKNGGLLLRFAGPNMTREQGNLYLTPVPLRAAGRSMEGSLTWQNPLRIQEFPQTSPLYGIPISDDITVRGQILPDAAQDLGDKVWARLADGTPLITAAPLDKGLLVLVHTTATPDWSGLALSGTFVEILRRMVSISGIQAGQSGALSGGVLQPVWVLDGFGAVQKPGPTVQPIAQTDFESARPGPSTPPGLYGDSGLQQALNTGRTDSALQTAPSMPAGVILQTYGGDYEQDLLPYVLYAALCLLLTDWLIMAFMAAGPRLFWRAARPALFLLACLGAGTPAAAQDEKTAGQYEKDSFYADGLFLAYVKTGNAQVDSLSQQGLDSLARTLNRRTSVEPDGVAALNPETDTLAFFPLIYWPVTPDQGPLSPQALHNVQYYLDHGGTILFDTRDQNYGVGSFSGTQSADSLRKMIGSLNIPPLEPIKDDHVLTRSFYLLDSFPGRYSGGTLWVETQSASGRDGVSSAIIGSHDWAAAWAADKGSRAALSGGSRQQELAMRFGVNLVMYALTGNYKADQVHVPHILERLGQ